MMKQRDTLPGFTLLEILLVVAIIAILAGIIIVAINPAKQLANARDTQRRSDVTTISNAITQYTIKNSGVLPVNLRLITDGTCSSTDAMVSTSIYAICRTGVSCGQTDLAVLSNDDEYLTSLPIDPAETNASYTGYTAFKDQNKRVTVCSPHGEQTTISAVR